MPTRVKDRATGGAPVHTPPTRQSHAARYARAKTTDALARNLAAANTRAYLQHMRRTAGALGIPVKERPTAITDSDVLIGIRLRALVSARSIVNTRADRMEALLTQHATLEAAQAAFETWSAGQGKRIAAYESGHAARQAADDFTARNALTGTEYLGGGAVSGDDVCADAAGAGVVPIGGLNAYSAFPAHVGCPHFVVRQFTTPDGVDVSDLWYGGD